MTITRMTVLLFAAAMLQACASPVLVDRIEPGATLEAAPQQYGYLALMQSYGVSETWRANVSNLQYRLKRTEGGIYELPFPLPKRDGQDLPGAMGAYPPGALIVSDLLVVALPPGEYEFTDFLARAKVPPRLGFTTYGQWVSIQVYNPLKPLSSRFRVESGRVTYVGEAFVLLSYQRYGMFFINRESRDWPMLSQLYPQLDRSRVDVRIPQRVQPAEPLDYAVH